MQHGNGISRFLDRCAYVISPSWGASRMATRAQWENFSGVYHDGASKDRLHNGKWLGSKISPDSALEGDLETLRGRSHELYRSDSLGGMVDTMVDHIVGQGFTCNAKIRPVLGISDEAASGFNASIEALVEQWSKAVCISRIDSWWEIDRLLCRHLLIDGEAFLVMSSQADGYGVSPVPLVLEVVDPERVETPPEKESDNSCRMGIQYDSRNRIIGYWIRTTHPHDTKDVEIKYQYVPKSRCKHLMERWFTGQSRGYPWMTRVLNDARDGKDIREAGLVAAQVQACLSVWIKGPKPKLNAQSRSSDTDTAGRRIQTVEPGSVNYIGESEEPIFLQPSGATGLSDLLTMNDRRIAAGMNIPYEFIARNWNGVSFAGGRLILNGAKISVGVKQKLIAIRAKAPVYHELVRQGVILGQLDINPSAYNRRPWVYQRHHWTHPLWSYAITPGEEVRALREAVDGNLTTQEAATAQYSGMDSDEVIPQRGKELEAQRKANCLPKDQRQAEAQATAAENNQGSKPDGGA